MVIVYTGAGPEGKDLLPAGLGVPSGLMMSEVRTHGR
jgi:hypothetical protein